jgi:hypothetical protein
VPNSCNTSTSQVQDSSGPGWQNAENAEAGGHPRRTFLHPVITRHSEPCIRLRVAGHHNPRHQPGEVANPVDLKNRAKTLMAYGLGKIFCLPVSFCVFPRLIRSTEISSARYVSGGWHFSAICCSKEVLTCIKCICGFRLATLDLP